MAPPPAVALVVAGQIRSQANGVPVSGVTVDVSGPSFFSTQSDSNGQYSLTVPSGAWTIRPHKSGDRRAGLTAADALHLLQSLSGGPTLNSSQQLVCDVSGDGSRDRSDVRQMLQVKLHTLDHFSAQDLCASSWLFVPVPATIAGATSSAPRIAPAPCIVGSIQLPSLTTDALAQNFEAVMIGDCNESWPNAVPLATLTRTPTFSRTATPSLSPTRSRTSTITVTPTITPTITRTGTRTRTATATPTITRTRTPSRTATVTRTASPTVTQTMTPSGNWPQLSLGAGIAGITMPVQITNANDGSGRLFVVEQTGTIRFVRNGTLQPTPFLNISSRINCCGERGLLSVAFPANFAVKRYFYVNYSDSNGDTVVARFRLTANDDVADPSSEERVLFVSQPYSNHNGGQLQFGPDGYLYIGMGDGGSGNDPQNRAQNYTSLHGKMLRIDVEAPTPTGTPTPYQVPATNPTPPPTPGARPEIWAAGLRNPWRFSFDSLTGDLYIADVGQSAYEEVDFQPAASSGGANYGWRIMEGGHCTNLDPCTQVGLTLPIAEYTHDLGCSISGGYVYRGTSFPCMYGIYFFGDYCSGRIWGLRRKVGVWENIILLTTSLNITSFGTDEAGNVWVADQGSGTIYPLNDACIAPLPSATPTPPT